MKLRTDHAQWYDAIFDGEGATFHRMAFTRGGLLKREQLDLFDRIGLQTPPHGIVRALAERISADQRVVVYEDELAHRGLGKLLLPLAEAIASHPDAYATLFFPPADRAAIVRHVRFGLLGFWIRQQTRGADWWSNIDDDEELLGRTDHAASPIDRVLWAIDFLSTPFGLLAIDFNTAPDLDTLAGSVDARELLTELERAEPQALLQF